MNNLIPFISNKMYNKLFLTEYRDLCILASIRITMLYPGAYSCRGSEKNWMDHRRVMMPHIEESGL